MYSYEVSVNGSKLCRAGSEKAEVISVIMVARLNPETGELGDSKLTVGSASGDLHSKWGVDEKLNVGDEMVIKIVDDAPDEPVSAEPSSKQIEEEANRGGSRAALF